MAGERTSALAAGPTVASSGLLVAALFAGLLAFLLLVQNRMPAFERGHHGWVSAHTLAMVGHLGADTGFVGYSVQSRSPEGTTQYDYFQRSPPVFDAALKLVLDSFTADAGERILLARQVMNAFSVAIMFLAYFLLRRLGTDRPVALASVLLAFSGYFIAFYRDLVSVDPPAILGLFIVLCGISAYRRAGQAAYLYGAVAVGVSLGAGFSSLPAISLWALFEIWERGATGRPKTLVDGWKVMWNPGVRALLLAVGVVGLFIAYNTAMEARVRGVSIAETSLVDGAARRLGMGATAPTTTAGRSIGWGLHAQTLLERSTLTLLPYPFGVGEEHKGALQWYVGQLGAPILALVFAGSAALVWRHRRRLSPRDGPIYLLLALAGLAWLGPMKNLAVPHNYTTIYLIGWTLAVIVAFVSLFPRKLRIVILVAALGVFVGATLSAQQTRVERGREASLYTEDMDRIAALLPPGANVHVAGRFEIEVDRTPDLIPGAPYALPFFLPKAYLAPPPLAEYALARDETIAPEGFAARPLTPDNQRVFLFRMERLADSSSLAPIRVKPNQIEPVPANP